MVRKSSVVLVVLGAVLLSLSLAVMKFGPSQILLGWSAAASIMAETALFCFWWPLLRSKELPVKRGRALIMLVGCLPLFLLMGLTSLALWVAKDGAAMGALLLPMLFGHMVMNVWLFWKPRLLLWWGLGFLLVLPLSILLMVIKMGNVHHGPGPAAFIMFISSIFIGIFGAPFIALPFAWLGRWWTTRRERSKAQVGPSQLTNP